MCCYKSKIACFIFSVMRERRKTSGDRLINLDSLTWFHEDCKLRCKSGNLSFQHLYCEQ